MIQILHVAVTTTITFVCVLFLSSFFLRGGGGGQGLKGSFYFNFRGSFFVLLCVIDH